MTLNRAGAGQLSAQHYWQFWRWQHLSQVRVQLTQGIGCLTMSPSVWRQQCPSEQELCVSNTDPITAHKMHHIQ